MIDTATPANRPKRLESLLTVVEPVILKSVGRAFEDPWRVDEIEPVILEVDGALALGPGEPHGSSVATLSSYGKRALFNAQTTSVSKTAGSGRSPDSDGFAYVRVHLEVGFD